MAPGALLPDSDNASPSPTHVTFHAAKGKATRPILHGASMKPTFSSIPQIDFTNLFSPSLTDRQAIARQVGTAFREVGFLYAVNHGISEDLQNRAKEVVKGFFDLPEEEKMKVHLNKSAAIKGYEAFLETRLDPGTRGDCKEGFNIGEDPFDPSFNCPADFDVTPYEKFGAGQINLWPEKPEAFRSTLTEYRQAIERFAKQLLRIVALALDLEETYFDHMGRFPMAGLRPLHYPVQEVSDDVGIAAHADYSWFTLVWQMTSAPALEVLNHNGHWVPAIPIPNTLVVNVGDFLERATNDAFVSTVHRVVNRSGAERYSMPYFFTPSHDVMIDVVPTCWSAETPKKYAPVLAGDWQRERLMRSRYKHPASVAAREKGEI